MFLQIPPSPRLDDPRDPRFLFVPTVQGCKGYPIAQSLQSYAVGKPSGVGLSESDADSQKQPSVAISGKFFLASS